MQKLRWTLSALLVAAVLCATAAGVLLAQQVAFAGRGVTRASVRPQAQPRAVTCALQRLPDSPLQRRNLIAALRRLDGVQIAPGAALYPALVLGPWCADEYCLAPCRGGGMMVAALGAGAEGAASLACAACRAAGLKVDDRRPEPLSPGPVSLRSSITNVTGRCVVLRATWRSGRPAVSVLLGKEDLPAALGKSAKPPAPATVLVVGDITCDPRSAPPSSGSPEAVIEAGLARLLRRGDLTLGNLECPLTLRTTTTKLKSQRDVQQGVEYLFRGDPEHGSRMLAALGLDIACTANNHVFDYGDTGITDTAKALHARGLLVAGPCGSGSASSAFVGLGQPAARRPRGFRVAAFATTETLPAQAVGKLLGGWVLDTRPGHLAGAREQVATFVKACRRRKEIPIVFFHWGVERSAEPTLAQRALARAAAYAGAALVVGSHPHRLQPVDALNGCVIAYSLGNFVFAPVRDRQELSGVLVVEVLGGRPFAAGLVPVRVSRQGRPQLVSADSQDARRILEDIGVEMPEQPCPPS